MLDPVTAPTPWLIETEVAPDTLQARVEDEPEVMVEGVAVNEEMTGAAGGGGVGESLVPPPQAETTQATKSTATTEAFRSTLDVVIVGHS